MSASFPRILNKRKGSPPALPGETVIDIDRTNPVLGNRHVLIDANNKIQRRDVIDLFTEYLQRDLRIQGPMHQSILDIAARVTKGERIALRCWCAPKPCHGDVILACVARAAGIEPPGLFSGLC